MGESFEDYSWIQEFEAEPQNPEFRNNGNTDLERL